MTTLIRTTIDKVATDQTPDELAGQGVWPPRYTTAARDALVNPSTGLVIYNTTTNKLNVRVAAAWEAITSA